MGETIAAALVIGSSAEVTSHLFATGYSMPGGHREPVRRGHRGEFRAALIGIGLLLFVITILVNLAARGDRRAERAARMRGTA